MTSKIHQNHGNFYKAPKLKGIVCQAKHKRPKPAATEGSDNARVGEPNKIDPEHYTFVSSDPSLSKMPVKLIIELN